MPDLKVALIQAKYRVGRSRGPICAVFQERIEQVPTGVSSHRAAGNVFPRDFSMAPGPIAQRMDGPAVSWMKGSFTGNTGADIVGSLIIEENGRFLQPPDMGQAGRHIIPV